MILEFTVCLHTGHIVRIPNQPGLDHIGEEHATQSSIDLWIEGGEHLAHGKPLERLSAA